MEVVCDQCKTKLNIPDEKLPRDQVVRIACPKCKNKIAIDTRTPSPAESERDVAALEEPDSTGGFHLKFIESKRDKQPDEGYSYSDYGEDKALDFYEEGTKLALVMAGEPEQAQKIREVLDGLGYKGIVTPNTRDAIGKMRFHHFDLIFLCEGFDGQSLENSPVINHVNRMPMSVRRTVFFALMAEKFKSMDNMMAFAMSANVVINPKDMDRLALILKKATLENEKFYKVFTDILAQLGKA